jgi:mediator of RNA polymerase II transcription subunit 25
MGKERVNDEAATLALQEQRNQHQQQQTQEQQEQQMQQMQMQQQQIPHQQVPQQNHQLPLPPWKQRQQERLQQQSQAHRAQPAQPQMQHARVQQNGQHQMVHGVAAEMGAAMHPMQSHSHHSNAHLLVAQQQSQAHLRHQQQQHDVLHQQQLIHQQQAANLMQHHHANRPPNIDMTSANGYGQQQSFMAANGHQYPIAISPVALPREMQQYGQPTFARHHQQPRGLQAPPQQPGSFMVS